MYLLQPQNTHNCRVTQWRYLVTMLLTAKYFWLLTPYLFFRACFFSVLEPPTMRDSRRELKSQKSACHVSHTIERSRKLLSRLKIRDRIGEQMEFYMRLGVRTSGGRHYCRGECRCRSGVNDYAFYLRRLWLVSTTTLRLRTCLPIQPEMEWWRPARRNCCAAWSPKSPLRKPSCRRAFKILLGESRKTNARFMSVILCYAVLKPRYWRRLERNRLLSNDENIFISVYLTRE